MKNFKPNVQSPNHQRTTLQPRARHIPILECSTPDFNLHGEILPPFSGSQPCSVDLGDCLQLEGAPLPFQPISNISTLFQH